MPWPGTGFWPFDLGKRDLGDFFPRWGLFFKIRARLFRGLVWLYKLDIVRIESASP